LHVTDHAAQWHAHIRYDDRTMPVDLGAAHIALKSESRRKWCASNTNDGRPEGSTMMTHFFPDAFNCRKNGSLGERSNFGSKGRSFSMGRVIMLRGSIDSPSSTTRISSRSRKFSAPIASNCPT